MEEPLLRVRGLEAGYGDVQVLWGVDLDVPKQCHRLDRRIERRRQDHAAARALGNGEGDPRLLGVRRQGSDRAARRAEIVGEGIAHVPEGRRLFNTLSVHDNLLLGSYYRKDRQRAQEDLEFVFSIFPILRERASQDASTLSGGEQQMCAIGRGIMARPRLLIIDELSLGLAPAVVEVLAESLLKIRAQDMSVLLVEQDVATAFEISDYGYVLDSGRVGMHGPSRELLENAAVRDAYLGM